ncbi:hypothetical protein KCMC57_64450 (plasmid) [Kitasatospora sp. CMC57]|uniref:Uncharacterized protein n=1 Tax=Kitasatospora sp. CMC57 TaxID=3231513 RepID=A0AB33KC55_9ACTN
MNLPPTDQERHLRPGLTPAPVRCDDMAHPIAPFSEEPLFCTLRPHADIWHHDERRGIRWRDDLPEAEGASR